MSGAKKALREVLAALDGWIEGAQSNHEALGHRDSDCCQTFHPEDIRNMVADAARKDAQAKKRRKKADAARPSAVVIEVIDGVAGARYMRTITTGDTYTLNVEGFLISLDGGKLISKIDVPVTIKARIA